MCPNITEQFHIFLNNFVLKGYYKRTDEYLPILEREKIGCFEVPMVHSVVLVDLRQKKTQHLTFDPKNIKDYSGPIDDIIVFAHSARISGKNFS